MHQAWRDFRSATDPVSVWVERETTQNPDIFVSKRALLEAFNAHSRSKGEPTLTPNAFTRALKACQTDLREVQRTIAGRVEWCWQGIGLYSKEAE